MYLPTGAGPHEVLVRHRRPAFAGFVVPPMRDAVASPVQGPRSWVSQELRSYSLAPCSFRKSYISRWHASAAHSSAVQPPVSSARTFAPCSMSSFAAPRLPFAAAWCSGVDPFSVFAFGFAPARSSTATTSVRPSAAAECSAVPSREPAPPSMSAPFSISILTNSVFPLHTA